MTVGLTEVAEPTGPVIYYRDPDGRSAYSAVPRRTDDGRAFIAVRASEDVSFDAAPAMAAADDAPPASAEGAHHAPTHHRFRSDFAWHVTFQANMNSVHWYGVDTPLGP